jgi:hypothetical protein
VCVCFFDFSFFFFLSSPGISFTLLAGVVGRRGKKTGYGPGDHAHIFFFNPLDSRAPPSPLPFLSLSLSIYIKVVSVRTFLLRGVLNKNPD